MLKVESGWMVSYKVTQERNGVFWMRVVMVECDWFLLFILEVNLKEVVMGYVQDNENRIIKDDP